MNGQNNRNMRGSSASAQRSYGSTAGRPYQASASRTQPSTQRRSYSAQDGYSDYENQGYASSRFGSVQTSRQSYGEQHRDYDDRTASRRNSYYKDDYADYDRASRRQGEPAAQEHRRGFVYDDDEFYRSSSDSRAPKQKKQRSSGKKKGNLLLNILKGIGIGIFMIFAGIGKLFSGLNRKLDVFRRGEVSTVLVNTAVGGVLVVILLCVFMACKPGIDSMRAASYASAGKADAAIKVVTSLENDGYTEDKLNATRTKVAEGLAGSGKYTEALSVTADLPTGAERTELEQRINYANAVDLYESGDYSAAAQIFYQMNDYSDSASRYADCRCALAIEAYQAGNESSARSLLLDVPDVVSRISAAALKVTGSEGEAQKVLSAELFSADNLNHMEETMAEITAARDDMPNGRIAAGKRHTVGVASSGTVLAVGDNSYGQLNVSGWSGVTQVAAGAYHTVALRSDGTVLATGDNSQQQCEVSAWSDIVAIAAASYDTIGLKSDGSVVAAGLHSDKVSGWHGVTFIAGGSYSLGCLYDKGSMMSTHQGAQMDMGAVLYDLSVCGPVSVGVLYDGTLISSFDGAPEWTEMVSVTASETGILGIDVNGQVRSYFYRPGDAVEFTLGSAAVEVESSGTHHVVLCGDGSVAAFGNNDYGQCAVSDWQL